MEDVPQPPELTRISDFVNRGQIEQLEREAYRRHHWANIHEANKGRGQRLTAGVGQWKYDPELLTVTHDNGYEIDLEQLTNPAKLLDMLLQVSGKAWQTPETLGELVVLLKAISDEIFQNNIQGVFCPGGEARTVQWPEARKDTENGC
jgi:hypothetical protein